MAKTLIEVLTEQGVELHSSSSGRLVANCPFHTGDNEPSFTVYPTDTYYCFGCHVWGDAVKYLTDKGWESTNALKYVGIDHRTPRAEKSKVIKVKNTVRLYKFLFDCSLQYHNYALELPGAYNYLLNRGLSESTIKRYKLGYTDGKVLNLPWAYERELADEIGLMTRNNYETMSHRITIPNIIGEDQADFLMGRTIINDKIKYLGARMPKPLMGFHEIRHSPIVFLVEGQFDWLTLRQWGYPAICISGNLLKPYSRLPLLEKEVIIVPDIDDDGIGQKEAAKTAKLFGERATILDISPLRKEAGKLDMNKLMEYPDGEESFRQLVMQELPWIILSLKGQQKKWFPNLSDQMLLAST
jgi:DNA primase